MVFCGFISGVMGNVKESTFSLPFPFQLAAHTFLANGRIKRASGRSTIILWPPLLPQFITHMMSTNIKNKHGAPGRDDGLHAPALQKQHTQQNADHESIHHRATLADNRTYPQTTAQSPLPLPGKCLQLFAAYYETDD